MKRFKNIIFITAIIALGSHITAVPVEPSTTTEAAEATSHENKQTEEVEATEAPSPAPSKPNKDMETSNSDQQTTYVLPEHHSPAATGIGTGTATATGTYDPSAYTGYLTPEAFQQYLAQFSAGFAPYGYPGYGPSPVYPAPYAVQTGYDGLLVPSPASTSLTASGTVSTNSGGVITALTNYLPTLMDSIIFRVFITIAGAVMMLIFGGAVTTAICNLTPLCDISFKAVSYLRSYGAGNMGRMVAEEITPERVTRAAEIVRTAIRKYKEMQKQMDEEENTKE